MYNLEFDKAYLILFNNSLIKATYLHSHKIPVTLYDVMKCLCHRITHIITTRTKSISRLIKEELRRFSTGFVSLQCGYHMQMNNVYLSSMLPAHRSPRFFVRQMTCLTLFICIYCPHCNDKKMV